MSKKYQKQLIGLITIVIVVVLGMFNIDINNLFDDNNVTNNNGEIKLEKCIDGDTARFTSIGKTRFLLIDTPESTNKKEKYGAQASRYTCSMLKNAKSITYEYDGNQKDRYDRTLAYIFVDGKLLQEEIAKEGYVKKFYKYKKNYKYENRIRSSINDKYGLWEKFNKE